MKYIIKAQDGTKLSPMFVNAFENAAPVWRAKSRVKQEREAMANVPANPYDYTKYWRYASEDKAKLAKYIAEERGYSPEDAQEWYDASMKGSRAELGLAGAAMVALPVLGAISTGSAGIIPQIALNGLWGAESLNALKSGNGICRTVDLANKASQDNMHPTLRKKYISDAVKSGFGDLVDASIATPFLVKSVKAVDRTAKLLEEARYNKYLKDLRNTEGRTSRLLEFPGYQTAEWQPQPEFSNYMAPKAEYKSIFMSNPVMNDFSGVENIAAENFGFGGVRPNLGLQKLETERQSARVLNGAIDSSVPAGNNAQSVIYSPAMKAAFKEKTGYEFDSIPEVMKQRELKSWQDYVARLRQGHKRQ